MEDAAGILQRDALIALDAYWRIKRFAYDGSGNLEYMGCNALLTANTSDATWAIWKYTYSGTNVTIIEGPITGIWDNRATLAWN